MISSIGNPHGKPNTDIVKPVASAVDLVQHSRNKWTIDYALMEQTDAALYEMPFEYIKKTVYPIRSKNRRASYAIKWWQYTEARPGMRKALQGKIRFIATPGVAKYRIFVWMPINVLCNQGTLVFTNDTDYFFGVLHSHLHELWALRLGTALTDRPRYTPTTTFETYPFPWAPGKEPWDDPPCKPSPPPPRSWSGCATTGSIPPVSPNPSSKNARLPTCTTSAPPGCSLPIKSSMMLCSLLMAGLPT